MKKIFSFVAVILTALSIGLTSCTEDPATPLTVDMSAGKTAKISGTLLVNEDLTAATPTYSGHKATIIVSIPYSAILNDSKATGSWSTVISSDKKGVFEVEVPATTSGVEVSFAVSDVKGSQTQLIKGKKTDVSGKWSNFNIPKTTVKSSQEVVLSSVVGTFTKLNEDGSEI